MFVVVAQSPASEHNVLHPLDKTASGKVFKKWLVMAGLGHAAYTCTNAVKRVIRPGMRTSPKEYVRYLDKLDVELRGFKCVICLGKIAETAVASLELKEQVVFNLPHPSPLNRKLNDPKELQIIIEALQKLKKHLD
jgi:uracil-DNA glycosylase